MDQLAIIKELERNKEVFSILLKNQSEEVYRWKPAPDQWSLLEIICHLLDEEREDFKVRIRHLFEHPNTPPPSIDPQVWPYERRYMEQRFEEKLDAFLEERTVSIAWLKSLKDPAWKDPAWKSTAWSNTYEHPKLGKCSAEHFLVNWLAHDYLHIRQIDRTHYRYLQAKSQYTLEYAGTW